jgi:tRNA-modifying protein YgfZ
MTAGWFDNPRDVVQVAGPDAQTYLHSQLSQEMRDLEVGDSRWTFVLQPTGKVDVLARVLRVGEHEFVVDTDAGYGAAMLARLARFKIRFKVELEPVSWRCVSVRGAGASRVAVPPSCFAAACGWPGIEGIDLLGPSPSAPPGWDEIGMLDVSRMRIETGWPAMGSEIIDSTIPGETGIIPLTVSFTKGCYPGQELVERIDSRGGNVARRLRLVHSEAFILAGTELTREPSGAAVGRVTSVALTADGAGTVALAYVARGVDMPAALFCDGAPVQVDVIELG